MSMPDAKIVLQAGAIILVAFTKLDFPTDPRHIFLTSWGYLGERCYRKMFHKFDRWCYSKEEIEKEENIV